MYICCILYAQKYVYNFLTHSVHLWSQYDLYFVGQHDVPLLCVIKWWRLVVLFDQELSSSWDRRLWPQETWAEKRGATVPLSWRGGTPSNTMWPGPRSTSVPYQLASSSIQPFGLNRHGPKNCVGMGVGVPFFWGLLQGPHRTKSPGPRPTPIPSGILVHSAVWPQLTLAENLGLCPFRGGGAGSPFNTMLHSPRARPTSVPSGILIHAAVWPQ